MQEHERQQRAAIAMKFPNDPRNQEMYLARLKDQLEKRLAELKQWHARKKLEEQQYRHGLRQQHPMVSLFADLPFLPSVVTIPRDVARQIVTGLFLNLAKVESGMLP